MLSKVQRIEWNSASIAGYLISIRDFNENISSSGQLYWRFIDAYTNQRTKDGESNKSEYRRTAQSINTFIIDIFNPDGSPATIPNEHTLELEVFCDE